MSTQTEYLASDRTPKQKILVFEGGEVKTIEYAQFLEKFKVSGLVRIPASEFNDINMGDAMFGHFNLEKTNHQIGNKYLILKIQRHGVSATETEAEQPPLLSLEGAFIAECIQVKNNLPYDSLTPALFKHSMKGLDDKISLQKKIQKRYQASRKNLTFKEIVSKGVGFTLFKIIKKGVS